MAKLGKVCDVRDGTHDSPKYVENGYPLITSKNLSSGSIDFSDVNYISEEDYTKINQRSKVDIGDIIMPMIGTIGNPVIVDIEPVFAIKNVSLIKFINEEVYNRYILYVLDSDYFKRYIDDKNRGGTQKFISLNDIREFDFVLPDLLTQRQIAANLDKVTHTIDLCNAILEKLDLLVKARFVEMFGDPVSNSMSWSTEPMATVAPVVNYTGHFEKEVWLLNLDMVEAQTGKIIEYLYVDENEVGNSTCTFDTSNVLYSKLRPYLNKVVIPDRCGYATSELVPLQPVRTKINREYLAYMLRSDFFVNMINEKVAGAKMPRVSMGDFRKFDVPIPPLDLQNQFAAFVEQTDKSKLAVKQVLEKAETLKKALMQEYFG